MAFKREAGVANDLARQHELARKEAERVQQAMQERCD
jgi:hypothetical protein